MHGRLEVSQWLSKGESTHDEATNHQGAQCNVQSKRCLEWREGVLQILNGIIVYGVIGVVAAYFVDIILGKGVGNNNDGKSQSL